MGPDWVAAILYVVAFTLAAACVWLFWDDLRSPPTS